MFVVVLKFPPKKIRYLFVAGIIVLALIAAFLFRRGSVTANGAMDDANIARCLDCLQGFGWEVNSAPIEAETFLLSKNLSESYLRLQQEAGFDLRDHLGGQVTRYTFRVTNYPTGESGVLADVLVRAGQVIGGDIRTSDLSGFMHSLRKPN